MVGRGGKEAGSELSTPPAAPQGTPPLQPVCQWLGHAVTGTRHKDHGKQGRGKNTIRKPENPNVAFTNI